MGEIDFSKEIIKILDPDILQMIIKKAVAKGFTVQGFNKNVWSAPKALICAAMEVKKRGKYQSSIFLEAVNEIESNDKIIVLAKRWLVDKDRHEEIEQEIEQINLENTTKTKKDATVEEKNVQEDIKKENDENYEKSIQQLQTKNKKLQNKIQDLRIKLDNKGKETFRLQKEKEKLEKKIEEKVYENHKIKDEIESLNSKIKELRSTVDSYKQENLNYQEIFKRLPKILCFSKKDINKDNFPIYNIDQLHEWSDEYEESIKWGEYKEVWVIETDFSYSEVVKMKRLPCDKIILKRNIKSLIEKVGGFTNGYAKK